LALDRFFSEILLVLYRKCRIINQQI